MAAKRVRVKPWEKPVAVSHPDTGQFMTPVKGEYYRDDDPLVKAHGWLFADDDTIAEYYEAGDVEQATKAPGERRNVRRG